MAAVSFLDKNSANRYNDLVFKLQPQSAFSLIELMVVVAIAMVLAGFGMTNYFTLQDRQRVENTGKELVGYFRRIQNHAHTGNRGLETGDCHADLKEIAEGARRLEAWAINLSLDANYALKSFPLCRDVSANLAQGASEDFVLPRQWQLKTQNDAGKIYETLIVETLAGNTYLSEKTASTLMINDFNSNNPDRTNRQVVFLLTDEGQKYGYIFALESGAITTGCLCQVTSGGGGALTCDPINADCQYKTT
jgi:prepilin-type N-terminal cleavage/methylation domain-containing protein